MPLSIVLFAVINIAFVIKFRKNKKVAILAALGSMAILITACQKTNLPKTTQQLVEIEIPERFECLASGKSNEQPLLSKK